ncbi:DUF1716-domain-containing protein [Rozella allomycis CSF55]|uniref:DUF1716, eukaryotic domain-containing protein n=1 Tax=Rozella allomycis (strain CSF55) TaxID=988480 RepID=A0A075AVQ3_ROZAC|nr:DUF1716, eukaryotic domain-containing protein [Rozella allomycis CSF55]RKP22143.1 DUF1716-domain-containing protein [Rozella allomycis CSF55]|eukprot:EPZ34350.1 DUF1716, eukaryotic domain-containing protein [Rozella allomycis CSF55]
MFDQVGENIYLKKKSLKRKGNELYDENEQSKKLNLSEEIQEYVENTNVEMLDFKKIILRFEKAVAKNQEMRAKYSDDPQKFLDSESALDSAIKKLTVFASSPQNLPDLINLNTVETMLGLLTHENSDISVSIIDLFNEILDEDSYGDQDEETITIFVEGLINAHALRLFSENLERLNEEIEEEKQGVFNTLSIFENLVAIQPKVNNMIAKDTSLIEWLLRRIELKQIDSNKQYASELLSIILQDSHVPRLKVIELNGIETFLKILSIFKKRDPRDGEETEFMENIFNCLCSLLMENNSKRRFNELEGIELMNIIIKEKNLPGIRAIKVIDFALANDEGKANCEKLVEIGGLGPLFSFFMKKNTKKLAKKYKGFSESQLEEHVMTIIVSLFRNLLENKEDLNYLRLLAKFTENNFEKVVQLVHLHSVYYQKMIDKDVEIEKEIKDLENELDDDEIEETYYLRRLESGLFTLQMIDLIIAYLIESGNNQLIDFILQELTSKGFDLFYIRDIITEYMKNIDDESLISAETHRLKHIINLPDREI